MSERVSWARLGSGSESAAATSARPGTPPSRPAGLKPGNTSHRHGCVRLGLASVGRAAPDRGPVLRLRRCAGRAAQPGGGLDAPSERPVQQERETTGGPQPARHDGCVHRQRGRILRRVRPSDRHSRGARQRSPGCCSRRVPGRCGRAVVMMAGFEVPNGWTVQAFQFALKAAVKRGADPKTRPVRAGGEETRKGPSRQAGKQPRDGVPVGGSP
jgi:hypothetical protein